MHDLCYSQRVLRQTGLMDHMMERLHVNPAFAASVDGGLAWYEARTKCIFCPNAQRCHDWLEGAEQLRMLGQRGSLEPRSNVAAPRCHSQWLGRFRGNEGGAKLAEA